MIEKVNIEERKPVWLAPSDFYLDPAISDATIRHIASVIFESPYSIDEVKEINKFELFPVLQSNLHNVAGQWVGFNEEWLIEEITHSLRNRNWLKKTTIEKSYAKLEWMQKEYWVKLENVYSNLK